MESMVDGTFTRLSDNAIEGFKISDLGVKAVVRNMFGNLVGFSDVSSDSDLINLVLNYKNFVERGVLGKRDTYTSEAQVEAARENAEANSEGLSTDRASKIIQNKEIFWTENKNNFGGRRFTKSDLAILDNNKSKVFNNYQEFSIWYAEMTGNGSREGVIRDIHYFVDNKRFNLNYPSPILNKDGSKKVIKPVIITRREAEANRVVASVDTGRDVAVKKSGVSKTNTVLFNENFKMIKGRSGNTFSLDYHSFYPEFSSDYITESERDQAEIQANRGMVSLMARGINLVDVHARLKRRLEKLYMFLIKKTLRNFLKYHRTLSS